MTEPGADYLKIAIEPPPADPNAHVCGSDDCNCPTVSQMDQFWRDWVRNQRRQANLALGLPEDFNLDD